MRPALLVGVISHLFGCNQSSDRLGNALEAERESGLRLSQAREKHRIGEIGVGSYGVSTGFRGTGWGDPPSQSMKRLNRQAGMDVYCIPGESTVVAGCKAIQVGYHFLEDVRRFARAEVYWHGITHGDLQKVVDTLRHEWGNPSEFEDLGRVGVEKWKFNTGLVESRIYWSTNSYPKVTLLPGTLSKFENLEFSVTLTIEQMHLAGRGTNPK